MNTDEFAAPTAAPTPAALAFPLDEYAARVAALRVRMAAAGVDMLVIDTFEHLAYFTGYVPTAAMYQCCLMPLAGEPVLMVRSLDAPMLHESSWVRDSVLFDDAEDPLAVLERIVRARGWERSAIGLELDSHLLTAARARRIERMLPHARLVDFSGHMWEMRLVKSHREIEWLRACSRICDEATLAAVAAAGEGVPEREVAAAIYASALRAGADNTRLVLMQSGPRSSTLHGAMGRRTLAAGDVLHVEMVPHLRGYTARSMRPVSIGAPAARQIEAADALVRMQDEQFAAMRPGALAGEVDRVLREAVLGSGLAATYTNVTGYTLGLVAIPRTSDFTRVFAPGAQWRLEAGMVFHMYTMALGMAFSETVLVTADGAQRLTGLDRRLFTA